MKGYEATLIKDEPKLQKDSDIHRQIASSIIKAYKNCNSVALYGSWGAGKSSVVKMVTGELSIKEVIFDFWKTSDDKLKKAFLETIIKETENQSLKIKWGGKDVVALDLITGRYQEIKVKNTFGELTLGQKITTIIFLSMLSFFTLTRIHNQIKPYLTIDLFPAFWHLVIFFVVPSIIWIIIFSCGRAKDIALLVSRKVSMLSSNEIKQNSSTSSDLSELAFLEIYGQIIEQIEKDRLSYLVCLDNLDRMDKVKAKEVLDEIYLFINATDSQSIKFIVPLNSDVLPDIFKGGIAGSKENFIHKLFPIHFELPNLINFDWRAILKTKLKEAFKDIDEQLISEIESIFEATMSRHITINKNVYEEEERTTNYNLTPRDIIYFVNSMVSTYWLVSPLTIKFTDIALYVGIKQNNSKSLVDGYLKSLKDKHIAVINYFNSDERVKNLYKIHYQANTPYETILREPLTKALKNKDIDTIKKLLIGVPAAESFLASIIDNSKSNHSYEDIDFYYDMANKLNSDIFNIKTMITTLKGIFFDVIYKVYYEQCGYEAASPSNAKIESLLDFLKDYASSDDDKYYLNNFWRYELQNLCNTIKKKEATEPFNANQLNAISYLYKIINQKMADRKDVYSVANEIITTITAIQPTPNTSGQVNYSIDYLQFGLAILAESLYFIKQNGKSLPINITEYWNKQVPSYANTILNTGVYFFIHFNMSDAFIKTILTLDDSKFTLMDDNIKSNCINSINKNYTTIIPLLNNYTETETVQEITKFFECLHNFYSDIELTLKNKLPSMSIADTKNISLALVKQDINNAEYLPSDWYSNSELRNILTSELEAEKFIEIIKVAWEIGSEPTNDKEWNYYWENIKTLVKKKNWVEKKLSILASTNKKIPSDIGSELLQALKDSMHNSALFLQIYSLAKDYFNQEKKTLQIYFKKQFESPIDATHAEIIKSAKTAELTITTSMIKKFNTNTKADKTSEHTIKAKDAMKENFPEFNDKLN